jgi:hypothetical protein
MVSSHEGTHIMNDGQRKEIEQACRDLVLAITQYGDHRQADQAVTLFAEDATWLRGGTLYTGPEEIRESYRRGSPTQVARHISGGTVVTVVDGDHARSVTYYLAYNGDPGPQETQGEAPRETGPLPLGTPFSMGEWHDTFVRTPDGWRFASRATKRLFERPEDARKTDARKTAEAGDPA